MTECSNADIRDLLPDVVQETLDAEARLRVLAHIDACDDCTGELALLRVARAVRPMAAPIDVARIVAALPPRPAAARPSLVADAPASLAPAPVAPAIVAREARTGGAARRLVPTGVWRMAAALAAVAVGGWAVLESNGGVRGTVVPNGPVPGVAAESATTVTVRTAGAGVPLAESPLAGSPPASRPDSAVASRSADAQPTSVPTPRPALSLGDLSEYSDAELERMLDRIEKWDGGTSADPVPTVPLLPATERGTDR